MKTRIHFESTVFVVRAPDWVQHLSKRQRALWHDAVAHGVIAASNAQHELPSSGGDITASTKLAVGFTKEIA